MNMNNTGSDSVKDISEFDEDDFFKKFNKGERDMIEGD